MAYESRMHTNEKATGIYHGRSCTGVNKYRYTGRCVDIYMNMIKIHINTLYISIALVYIIQLQYYWLLLLVNIAIDVHAMILLTFT